MSLDSYIKKWLGPLHPAWKREAKQPRYSQEIFGEIMDEFEKSRNSLPCQVMFNLYPQNENIDIYTKRASLKASPSVVFLQFFSGEDATCECSGFIIESTNTYTIILTAASTSFETDDTKVIVHVSDGRSFDGQIEAYDLHYNIAAIKIQLDTPLPTASLAYLDDSITIDPSHNVKEESFQLRPHSSSFNIIPGDLVIALGRFIRHPYFQGHSIMAAPGLFRKTRRPWLGMEVTNLYAAPIEILERIIQKFPDVLKGVIVEEVAPGSSAEAAGIKYNDVIIQFGGKRIECVLELFESTWNKVGELVKLVVIRASDDVPVHLSMVLDEARSE
ncbi:putative protease Do-like 14 isoform X5 [Capsicum annuum]|uniref:putative protease Do-like 14 isoform X5 n=1 Tax=Capsicum annuum TaxID=4072 RepID=UPI001FB058A0|nr:putative protease Do-like 14 isoform X5 [Capsicum annuum]